MSTDTHWREIPLPVELEPPALAAALAIQATRRAAEAVVLTIDHLEEDGRALNQLQKELLVYTTMRAFDGLEQAIRTEIDRDLDRAVEIAEARRERARGAL